MKTFVAAALAFGLFAQPVFAGNGFAPGNPTFGQFEQTCHIGSHTSPDCRGSVAGAYAAHEGTVPSKVKCDDQAFWRASDPSKVVGVLPWQDVVAQIVAKPGVCHEI